jgi:transcriptional regulator with XRE-family HTH domain
MERPLSALAQQLLKNPKVRATYEAEAPRWELIHALIGARAEAKLTQAQLAKRMGTSQSAIARIEGDGPPPSMRSVLRYFAACGVRWKITLEKIPVASAKPRSKRMMPRRAAKTTRKGPRRLGRTA